MGEDACNSAWYSGERDSSSASSSKEGCEGLSVDEEGVDEAARVDICRAGARGASAPLLLRFFALARLFWNHALRTFVGLQRDNR